MVRPELAILLIVVTILFKTKENDAKFSEHSLGLVSKILGKHSNPLVVVINSGSQSNSLLRSDDNQRQDDLSGKGIKGFDDSVNGKKTLEYVSDILRSTGDENDPDVLQTNLKFGKALRSRCEAFLECQVKCKKQRKKKFDNCKKSCQDVFDYLMMCSQGKKKKKDSCEESEEDCGIKFTISCGPKCGKTMPPYW